MQVKDTVSGTAVSLSILEQKTNTNTIRVLASTSRKFSEISRLSALAQRAYLLTRRVFSITESLCQIFPDKRFRLPDSRRVTIFPGDERTQWLGRMFSVTEFAITTTVSRFCIVRDKHVRIFVASQPFLKFV